MSEIFNYFDKKRTSIIFMVDNVMYIISLKPALHYPFS